MKSHRAQEISWFSKIKSGLNISRWLRSSRSADRAEPRAWIADEHGQILPLTPAMSLEDFLRNLPPRGTLISRSPCDWRQALLARWFGLSVAAWLPSAHLQDSDDWNSPVRIWLRQAHLVVTPGDLSSDFMLEGNIISENSLSKDRLRGIVDSVAGVSLDPGPPPSSHSTRRRLNEQLRLREAFAACDLELERKLLVEIATSLKIPISETGLRRERPRVLFVSHDLTRTGAPLALFRTLQNLASRTLSFDIYVMGLGEGPMESVFRAAFGDRFQRVDLIEGPFPYINELSAMDRWDPDLVVLNGSPLYCELILLAWKGLPLIWWFHDGINVARRCGEVFSSPPHTAMVQQALSRCPRILVPAKDTIREIEAFAPASAGRVGWIPNGLDTQDLSAQEPAFRARRDEIRRTMAIERDDIVFMCVGSFEPRKNQVNLVKAFNLLAQSDRMAHPERLRLVMIGRELPGRDGHPSYLDTVRSSISREILDQVIIPGPQPGAEAFLVAADVHILVSTNEGSPLVNLEAMALGTPCISSSVHGIPEVVIQNVTGFLVDPEDVHDIARVMTDVACAIAAKDPLIEEVRERARKFVRSNHDIGITADALLREIETELHQQEASGILLGSLANDMLSSWLVHRWAIIKSQTSLETHLTRMTSHRLFDPTERF